MLRVCVLCSCSRTRTPLTHTHTHPLTHTHAHIHTHTLSLYLSLSLSLTAGTRTATLLWARQTGACTCTTSAAWPMSCHLTLPSEAPSWACPAWVPTSSPCSGCQTGQFGCGLYAELGAGLGGCVRARVSVALPVCAVFKQEHSFSLAPPSPLPNISLLPCGCRQMDPALRVYDIKTNRSQPPIVVCACVCVCEAIFLDTHTHTHAEHNTNTAQTQHKHNTTQTQHNTNTHNTNTAQANACVVVGCCSNAGRPQPSLPSCHHRHTPDRTRECRRCRCCSQSTHTGRLWRAAWASPARCLGACSCTRDRCSARRCAWRRQLR